MGTANDKGGWLRAVSRTQQFQFQNSGDALALNRALTPLAGSTTLSQLVNKAGVNVPLYNIFALPGSNSPDTIDAVRASGYQSGFSDLLAVEGSVRGSVFDLPAGPFEIAVGGQNPEE